MSDLLSKYLSGLKEVPAKTKYLQDEIDRYFVQITPILNQLHGLNGSKRFWRILLGSHVASCLKRNGIISWKVSLITGGVGNNFSSLGYILFYLRENKNQIKKNTFYRSINEILLNDDIIIGNRAHLMVDDIKGIIAENRFPAWFLMKKEGVKRKEVNRIAATIDDPVLKSIVHSFPEIYIEYFSSIRKSFQIINPKEKTFHCEQGVGQYWHFIIAFYVEEGAQLFYYQPGGWMGDVAHNNGYLGQRDVADKFVTYGWKLHDKEEPGRAYRLLEFKRNFEKLGKLKKTKLKSILVVLTDFGSQGKVYYEASLRNLISEINPSYFDQLKIRYRAKSRLLRKSRKKDINIQQSKKIIVDSGFEPMYRAVAEASLVVHLNHPATNFLECIAVDKPIMAVLTNNDPTDIILPHYDFFLKKGVLHLTVESLIEHLNCLEDLDLWWAQVMQCEDYEKFKREFANIYSNIQ